MFVQKRNPFIFLFYGFYNTIMNFPQIWKGGQSSQKLIVSPSSAKEEMETHSVTGDKQLKQNRAMSSLSQMFVTEEPGQSFLCVKEQVRGRAEEIHPKTGCKISTQEFLGSGKTKFKMGAGHRQREPGLPICPQQTPVYFSVWRTQK